MTSGAIHVAQVPESGWPCPLPLMKAIDEEPLSPHSASGNETRVASVRNPKSKIENPKSCVGPSAILTGSRTRPSDWGSNARFGPVEDRRNNRRLAPFTCTPCVLQIWWPSPLSSLFLFFLSATEMRTAKVLCPSFFCRARKPDEQSITRSAMTWAGVTPPTLRSCRAPGGQGLCRRWKMGCRRGRFFRS